MLAAYATFAALLSIVIYVTVSVLGRKEDQTTFGFFHDSGSPIASVLSLTSFNITLGTGLAYVIVQASQIGYLVFLPPIALTAGYILVAFYYRSLAFSPTENRPNIFFILIEDSDKNKGNSAIFGKLLCFFYALTFILLLGFELGVGAKFIAYSLFKEPSEEIVFGLALFVYGIVITYTYISGLRAAVQTDKIQFFFILALIGMLPFILPGTQSPNRASVDINLTTLQLAILSILTAITTQFYSIVNPQVATPHKPEVQFRILIWTGILTGMIYLVIASIGFYFGTLEALQTSIQNFLYSGKIETLSDIVFVVLLFMAMMAVLLSTLDNVTIASSQLIHDLIQKKTTMAKRADIKLHSSWRFKAVYAVGALIGAGTTSFVVLSDVNIYGLLLTILFAAAVMAPICCTAVYLKANRLNSLIDSRPTQIGLFALTLAGWMIYAFLTKNGKTNEGSILHIAAILAASSFAFIDYKRNAKGK